MTSSSVTEASLTMLVNNRRQEFQGRISQLETHGKLIARTIIITVLHFSSLIRCSLDTSVNPKRRQMKDALLSGKNQDERKQNLVLL